MVKELLKNAAERLTCSDTPMLDARILLAKAMGKSDAALVFNAPSQCEKEQFERYIAKRASGIPVAYILGEKEFMGLCFRLNSDTLIPRPDTECLVEKIIEKNTFSAPKIIDLCTGSGCIGISLAHFIEKSSVALTDICEGAIIAAEENARLNGVTDRTKVFRLDVINDAIGEDYDIIVSNPPYIKSGVLETLEVSKYEPLRALDGGKDGLVFYRVIAKKAYSSLKRGGMLAFEIGYDQGESVRNLLADFSRVMLFKDYGGRDRVVIAVK